MLITEKSSVFEVDKIKNEAILRDFLQKWKFVCKADGLVPMRLPFFPFHLSKVLRLPRKLRPGHTKFCTCHTKSSQQTWRSNAPKTQPFSGNQCPDFLKCLMNMSLVARLPREMHLCRSTSNVPSHCYKTISFCSLLARCRTPSRLPRKTTSELAKVVRDLEFFNFDFQMCFAPQQRALFHHLNIHKWSEHAVLCICWLRNAFGATRACNFLSLVLPYGAAPATLAPEPQIVGKTPWFATFLLFARLHLLSDSFSSLIFFLLLFSSLLWFFPPVVSNPF